MLAQRPEPLWPLAIYFGGAVVMVATIMLLSHVIGQRHQRRGRDFETAATGQPYESGIAPTTPANSGVSVRFYMVAMLFVIFDLEAVFIFTWAVALCEAGWAGYVEVAIFIGVLLAALVYVLRQGILDWAHRGGARGKEWP